jgi:hypothetical protein
MLDCPKAAHLDYVLCGQASLAVLFAALVLELAVQVFGGAALGRHVSGIVSGCSKEKMVWATAGRIVASVQDPSASRDRAVRQLPCVAVGTRPFAARESYVAVPGWPLRAEPDPTVARLVDAFPESLVSREFAHTNQYTTGCA